MPAARPLEKNIANIRRILRALSESLARAKQHLPTCTQGRGCGCSLDRALAALDVAHESLWSVEMEIYSRPRVRPEAGEAQELSRGRGEVR